MSTTTAEYAASCGSVKHVNLMVDTFIANAPVAELRAIIRTLLCTVPNATAPFNHIARSRLKQTMSKAPLPPQESLFSLRSVAMVPTHQFTDILSEARTLFGAGLGVDSLPRLIHVIQATFPLRWTVSDEDQLLDDLAIVDCDVSQAVQSCKEEISSGNLDEEGLAGAQAALEELYQVLEESKRRTAAWGGEFAFDRAFFAAEDWRRKALRGR